MFTYSDGTFVYQNSSAPFPDARIENIAVFMLRGKVSETLPLESGNDITDEMSFAVLMPR